MFQLVLWHICGAPGALMLHCAGHVSTPGILPRAEAELTLELSHVQSLRDFKAELILA